MARAADCACFRFHRRSKNANNRIANKPRIPPTTPPTIFPVSELPPDELAADVEVDSGSCVPLVAECPGLRKYVTEELVSNTPEIVVDEKLVVEDIEEDVVIEDWEDVGDAVVVDDEDEKDVSDWGEVADTTLVGDEIDEDESN